MAADNFEQVLAEVNPEAQASLVGQDYLVSGLPLSWGRSNVKAFLGSWDTNPVGQPLRVGFRHTWTVRATQEPLSKVLKNPDPLGLNVLAVITTKEYRPRPAKTVLKQQRVASKQAKPRLPKSWAEVAAQRNHPGGKPQPASMELAKTTSGDVFQNTEMTQETLSAPAIPADFMSQLQIMIQSVVRKEMKPVYAELEQVKAAVEEEAGMQAEVGNVSEEEDDDYDDDKALAQLAAAPASTAASAASAGTARSSVELEEGTRKTGRSNPY